MPSKSQHVHYRPDVILWSLLHLLCRNEFFSSACHHVDKCFLFFLKRNRDASAWNISYEWGTRLLILINNEIQLFGSCNCCSQATTFFHSVNSSTYFHQIGVDRSAVRSLLFNFSEILWLLSLQNNNALEFMECCLESLSQVGKFSHLFQYE